jgi:hypothetical protein
MHSILKVSERLFSSAHILEARTELLAGSLKLCWRPSTLLKVAESYWWATNDENEHNVFLTAFLKHILVFQKMYSSDDLCSQIQRLMDRVQHATASIRVAASRCLSAWLTNWVNQLTSVQDSAGLLKAALDWLHTMHSQKWQRPSDTCISEAFCKVKFMYMKLLLESGQHEQMLQLVQASREEFGELAAATATTDLQMQVTCILNMNDRDLWQSLGNILSSATACSAQEQLQVLLPLLVKNTNLTKSDKQAEVCPGAMCAANTDCVLLCTEFCTR